MAGSVAKPRALPTPPAPVVSAIDGGSLWAGEYLVATSYCCWDRVSLLEEGGRSPLTQLSARQPADCASRSWGGYGRTARQYLSVEHQRKFVVPSPGHGIDGDL